MIKTEPGQKNKNKARLSRFLPLAKDCSSAELHLKAHKADSERRTEDTLGARQGSSLPGVSMDSSSGQFWGPWGRQYTAGAVLRTRDRPANPPRTDFSQFLLCRRRVIPVIVTVDIEIYNHSIYGVQVLDKSSGSLDGILLLASWSKSLSRKA